MTTTPDGRPGCEYCAERLRVNVGLLAENTALKRKLREKPEADMRARATAVATQIDLAVAMAAPEIRGLAEMMAEWAEELRGERDSAFYEGARDASG